MCSTDPLHTDNTSQTAPSLGPMIHRSDLSFVESCAHFMFCLSDSGQYKDSMLQNRTQMFLILWIDMTSLTTIFDVNIDIEGVKCWGYALRTTLVQCYPFTRAHFIKDGGQCNAKGLCKGRYYSDTKLFLIFLRHLFGDGFQNFFQFYFYLKITSYILYSIWV